MKYKIIILFSIILLLIIIYSYKINEIKKSTLVYKPLLLKNIHFNLYPTGFMVELISNDPKIYYIHNFITNDEANYMIKLTEKYKEESTLEINKNTSDILDKKVRTSLTAYLKKGVTDKIEKIEKRAADFANVSYDRIEALQTVVYNNNEYYQEHLDTFPVDSKYMQNVGNRISTIFVYMTTLTPEEGGKTNFINLNLSINPIKCHAIYFENIKDNKVDYRLLHQGEKVIGLNKKYGINIWIREFPVIQKHQS